MICFHKYGEIKNSYQYCSKCGLAKKVNCAHRWKIIRSGGIDSVDFTGKRRLSGHWYHLQCEMCGEIKNKEC